MLIAGASNSGLLPPLWRLRIIYLRIRSKWRIGLLAICLRQLTSIQSLELAGDILCGVNPLPHSFIGRHVDIQFVSSLKNLRCWKGFIFKRCYQFWGSLSMDVENIYHCFERWFLSGVWTCGNEWLGQCLINAKFDCGFGIIERTIQNADPLAWTVCKRHELNNFRVQSEVRSIGVLIQVACVVHMRPVDYIEVLSVGCKVIVPSLTGRMQREGNCIILHFNEVGSRIFCPLNDEVNWDTNGNVVCTTHTTHVFKLRCQGGVLDISILVDVGSPMHIPVWRINHLEDIDVGSTYILSFLASLGNGQRSFKISSCFQIWCTNVLASLPVYDVKCLCSCTEVTKRALSFSKQLVVSRIHFKLF